MPTRKPASAMPHSVSTAALRTQGAAVASLKRWRVPSSVGPSETANRASPGPLALTKRLRTRKHRHCDSNQPPDTVWNNPAGLGTSSCHVR
eukprot:1432609-Rhodomonas_salina.5